MQGYHEVHRFTQREAMNILSQDHALARLVRK
jgi:hypothetical protein